MRRSAGGSTKWFSALWSSRFPIYINGNGVNGAAYPVTVHITYNSKMLADFSDVRFTSSDGKTELPFWAESITASTDAYFVISVPLSTSSATVVYCYYGNSGAESASNGFETFPLFDDWRGVATPEFYSGFQKDGLGPLASMEPSQVWEWEEGNCQDPKIYKYGDTYYMFYAHSNPDYHNMDIGVATATASDYPRTWTKSNSNPVLSHGGQSGIDDGIVTSPVIIKMPDGSFRMYYNAYTTHQVGCVAMCSAAEFPNTWHKYSGNPIIDIGPSGEYDDGNVSPQMIIPPWESNDGLWHMIYGGGNSAFTVWRVGHATSVDGLTWVRDPANPVLSAGDALEFDSLGVYPVGQPLKKDGVWYLPYQGSDNHTWRMGVFTTTDFRTWNKLHGPILVNGIDGEWDGGSAENPGVVFHEDTGVIDLFYVSGEVFEDSGGKGVGGLGEDRWQYRIGIAHSTDFVASRIDPQKWRVSNWNKTNGGVPWWPQVVDGNLHLQSMLHERTGIQSVDLFGVGYAVEAKFSMPINYDTNTQLLEVGWGADGQNYVVGRLQHSSALIKASAHVINGVGGGIAGAAYPYTSGWIRVKRTATATEISIKHAYTDAWTLLESIAADGMGVLPIAVNVYDALASARIEYVLVKECAGTEPAVSIIGTEQTP